MSLYTVKNHNEIYTNIIIVAMLPVKQRVASTNAISVWFQYSYDKYFYSTSGK